MEKIHEGMNWLYATSQNKLKIQILYRQNFELFKNQNLWNLCCSVPVFGFVKKSFRNFYNLLTEEKVCSKDYPKNLMFNSHRFFTEEN